MPAQIRVQGRRSHGPEEKILFWKKYHSSGRGDGRRETHIIRLMTQQADKQAEQAGWEFAAAAAVNEKRQNDKTVAGNKKK